MIPLSLRISDGATGDIRTILEHKLFALVWGRAGGVGWGEGRSGAWGGEIWGVGISSPLLGQILNDKPILEKKKRKKKGNSLKLSPCGWDCG